MTFETEEGSVVDESGEAIRFAPGEYQQGTNTGTERVEAIALGAPQDGGDFDLLRDCETCGERTSQATEWTDDRDAKRTRCPDCGGKRDGSNNPLSGCSRRRLGPVTRRA